MGRALLIAFLAGLGSAIAFAPLSLWPAMPIAFAVLIHLLLRAPSLGRALMLGWAFGLGQFVLGLNWIATAFTYQAAMPAWLGWVAVLLLSIYLAVYPALAAGLAWRFHDSKVGEVRATSPGDTLSPKAEARNETRPEDITGIDEPITYSVHIVKISLLLASGWIVTEWLRAGMFTGFAWNPVGVIWVGTPTAGAAVLIGTYGLSALAVLSGGMLLAVTRRRWTAAAPLAALPVLAVIPALIVSDPGSTDRSITVIQPNIDQEFRNSPDYAYDGLVRLAALSRLPDRPTPPRLLLWPEAAVEYYLEDDPVARDAVARLLRPRDMLLTGGTALERNEAGTLIGARNSLYAMDGTGRLLARYDKAHLVPYGEYLPARPILSAVGLSRLVPGDLDFWSGPGPRTYTLPGFGSVGVQICYEIIFSGEVVDGAHRPDFLFNPSNDAWFGAWGPPQHLAQARMRAIEEGLPVVRSTPNGISALIDANGDLTAFVPRHEAGVIEGTLPRAHAPTPFARVGNWLPFLFAALLAGAAIAVPGTRRYGDIRTSLYRHM